MGKIRSWAGVPNSGMFGIVNKTSSFHVGYVAEPIVVFKANCEPHNLTASLKSFRFSLFKLQWQPNSVSSSSGRYFGLISTIGVVLGVDNLMILRGESVNMWVYPNSRAGYSPIVLKRDSHFVRGDAALRLASSDVGTLYFSEGLQLHVQLFNLFLVEINQLIGLLSRATHLCELSVHDVPLGASIEYIEKSKRGYDQCSYGSDSTVIRIEPANHKKKYCFYCFQRSHYVLGVFAGIFMFIMGIGGLAQLWDGVGVWRVGVGCLGHLVGHVS